MAVLTKVPDLMGIYTAYIYFLNIVINYKIIISLKKFSNFKN